MKKKALIVATVVKHHIVEFHLPYMKYLHDMGVEVHVCAKNDYENEDCNIPYCDCFYEVNFTRAPFSLKTIDAYISIKKVIKEGNYDLIHCHTPVAAILTRLAARRERRFGTTVIYTAHGFHFYKGVPPLYWMLFYPVEWICSWMTDLPITINQEDFQIANNRMHAKRTVYCPGVGIDVKKFSEASVNRKSMRESLKLKNDDIMILTVGELIKRKNQEVIIRSLSKLKNYNLHLFIAGEGELREYLEELIDELDLRENVHMLGYISDVGELYYVADLFCFPSLQEGLGMAALEAMACGLPIITSNVRGITEYSVNEVTGFTCDPTDIDKFTEYIELLSRNSILRKEIGQRNVALVNKFDISNSIDIVGGIYNNVFNK